MYPAYENFTSTDFLTDDSFVDHQLLPNQKSTEFWDHWLAAHPEKLPEWEHALYLLDAVRLGLFDYAKTFLSDAVIDELLNQIKATNAGSESKIVRVRWFEGRLKWAAAACLVLSLGIGGLWWKINTVDSIYRQQVAALTSPYIEKVNSTDSIMTFRLSDGSEIELSPDSRLGYSEDFNRENRRVFLTGEATFEVTKNTNKPFLVYASKVVTKVLGTKFMVRAYYTEKDVKVNVESGQVSVFQDSQETENEHPQYKKGLILLPNQQAVFSRQTEEFNKTLVKEPVVLADKHPGSIPFIYDEVPIAKVFGDLEKAYGIPIRFNKEGLEECQLSASLVSESFEEKLDIICKTVKASYQILDGQIIISGGSCK